MSTVGAAAVVFLLRAADRWRPQAERFLRSYRTRRAGAAHQLHLALKGFDESSTASVAATFADTPHRVVPLPEAGRDIGSYIAMLSKIDAARVCFLNSHSEILAHDWLAKLELNLERPGVGMVGSTGSFESLHALDPGYPTFPNVHLRTNGFMLKTRTFMKITRDVRITDRSEALLFESGTDSMTRRVQRLGLEVLVVGRNGRGYPPAWWPWSDGFRQGLQHNLLIGDNQTRHFDELPRQEKAWMSHLTWRDYRDRSRLPTASWPESAT